MTALCVVMINDDKILCQMAVVCHTGVVWAVLLWAVFACAERSSAKR